MAAECRRVGRMALLPRPWGALLHSFHARFPLGLPAEGLPARSPRGPSRLRADGMCGVEPGAQLPLTMMPRTHHSEAQ